MFRQLLAMAVVTNTPGSGVILYVSNTFRATILYSSKTYRVEDKPHISEYIMSSIQQGSEAPQHL